MGRVSMQPCLAASCSLPVALDGTREIVSKLCAPHVLLATGLDLAAVDRSVRCQAMAGTCPIPATKDCDIVGWYCEWHAPRKWRPKRKDDSAAIAKSRAFVKAQRNKPKLSLD